MIDTVTAVGTACLSVGIFLLAGHVFGGGDWDDDDWSW